MTFADIIKKGAEEGKEKHVPFIKTSDCSGCNELTVEIRVGETIFHPSTPDHFIDYIELYGIRAEDDLLVKLTRFELGREDTVPYVKTHIKKGKFKSLIALSLCNIHGLWEGSLDL